MNAEPPIDTTLVAEFKRQMVLADYHPYSIAFTESVDALEAAIKHMGDASTRKDEAQAHRGEPSDSLGLDPVQLGDACNIGSPSEIPVPIGKYSGAHPYYKHRRIIGYLYDDVWPELWQLPDNPMLATKPVSVSLGAADAALGTAYTTREGSIINPRETLANIAKAWGLPYVD